MRNELWAIYNRLGMAIDGRPFGTGLTVEQCHEMREYIIETMRRAGDACEI